MSYKSVFVLTIPVVRERIVYYALLFPLRLIPYSDVLNRIIVEFSAILSSNFLKMFVLILGCLTTVVFYPSTRHMTYDKESCSWKMHHLISNNIGQHFLAQHFTSFHLVCSVLFRSLETSFKPFEILNQPIKSSHRQNRPPPRAFQNGLKMGSEAV